MRTRHCRRKDLDWSVDVSRLRELTISQDGFAFDPLTGYSYQLNPVATRILRCLQKGMSVRQITNLLVRTYDAKRERVQRDLHEFIERLQDFMLLA